MGAGGYTTDGKTIGQIREESRRFLALTLVYVFAGILLISIIIAGLLLWFDKINFDNGLTMILAISAPFSGLLGSAITFYFSSTNDSV